MLREHGIISVLNVPIFVDGSHWGVLEVDTVEKTTFEEFEIHSLSIFADIIGLSLAQRRCAGRRAQAAQRHDSAASKPRSCCASCNTG